MTAPAPAAAQDLELGMVGNGSFGALFDARARLVWCCLPAFDGDPAFCELLQPEPEGGFWAIELENLQRSEQAYDNNTAILRTVLPTGRVGLLAIRRACSARSCVRTSRRMARMAG